MPNMDPLHTEVPNMERTISMIPRSVTPTSPRAFGATPSLAHKRSNLRISRTFDSDSPPSSSSSAVPQSPTAALANMSIRPRRPSLHLHEIHPPPRRLSAHQVLLLTPFGGASPPPTPPSGGSNMARSPSSMGRPLPLEQRGTLWTRTRTRHSSLVSPTPPMTGSRPMATIPSNSDSSAASADPSREPSRDEPSSQEPVPMTRSNSLPVLTLRELDALKEKDEELGINRGRAWAWVSRESPTLAESSSASLVSMEALTPPAVALTFGDPFRAPGVGREIAPFTHQYQPVSTAEGYHYSPTWNDRRMSETPSLHSLTASQGTASPLSTSRRPSAPSEAHITPKASYPTKVPEVAAIPIPPRPKLLRYKTSPAQHTALGLEIHVSPKLSQSPRDSRRPSEASTRSKPSRPSSGRGEWAPVDIVDPLELDIESELSRKSGSSSSRTSISITQSNGATSTHNLILFANSFPTVDEFGKSLERGRFDSVDSAMPKFPKGFEALAKRAGSLAVMEANTGRRSWEGRFPILNGWQERRGSWAETWDRDVV